MPMLYKEDLPKHCEVPGCTCTDRDGFYLHGRCHPASGVVAHVKGRTALVACKTCDKEIATLAVLSSQHEHILRPRCHSRAKLAALCKGGLLLVECDECRQPAIVLAVRAEHEPLDRYS
jgi:hypothetical protein